ncbi:putative nucleic acid-binding Zn ribbon protein [Rhizobium sp. BIGb0125]|nr:putative nucleic acid-binding Zn ribbon protein [Rhizobium sp. BIGb0125]
MIGRGVDAGATNFCHGQYFCSWFCREVTDFQKKKQRRHSESKQPYNIILR